RDRSRADAPAGGALGQVGAGAAAHRADLALPLASRSTAGVHRPAPAPRRQPRGDHRAAGVHPGPLVAADPPQPDGAPNQGHVPLPQERDRHRRALPPAALSSGTLNDRVIRPMKLTLAVDGPFDAAATLARYHRWGEDPATRLDGDVLRRVLRLGERVLPYEVRTSGTVDDARLTVRVPDGGGAGARRSTRPAASCTPFPPRARWPPRGCASTAR